MTDLFQVGYRSADVRKLHARLCKFTAYRYWNRPNALAAKKLRIGVHFYSVYISLSKYIEDKDNN